MVRVGNEDAKKCVAEEPQRRLWQHTALAFVGIGLLLVLACELGRWPFSVELLGSAMMVLFLPIYLVGRLSQRLGASLTCACLLALTMLALVWFPAEATVCILALPCALCTITLGLNWGAGASVLSTALALTGLLSSHVYSPITKGVALALIWGMQALLYGMLSCINETVEWSWSSYENMRDLLEKARDQQLALRQAQADLEHANIQLARLSERLDAMRHIAEEARRVKEEFLANVSHELRTPLNMIIGFSEMITRAPDAYGGVPSELLADLEVILANSRHLASLVDDVLDLSQADAGRMVLSKEWVPIRELVTSAIAAVKPLFASKGLYLEHSVSCDVEVFCDRTRLRQVLVNLLSNAGRYTKRGGARLEVVLRGRDVVLSVADTGPGIDPKDQERVFLPFEQASTGAVGGKGSGLGLAISKRFVEMHGGRIWLESEVGKGSTFYVSLPTVEPPPLRSDWTRWINPYAAHEPNARRPSGENLDAGPRFVVVERGKSLQRFVSRHWPNAEVVPTLCVEQALAELAKAPAHAVIVNDERYRAVPRGITTLQGLPLGTPVIGCWLPDKHDAAERLGVVDYLLKPVTQDRLLSVLDSLGRPVRSVLLVDDEFDALQLFARMLESACRDYRVYRASDGRRALAHLRRYRPDVMLLDLVMPGMDGYALLAEKNADDTIRDIPVIALSAQDPMRGSTMPNVLTVARTGGLDPRDLVNCLRAVASLLQPASSSVGPASLETTGETQASSGS